MTATMEIIEETEIGQVEIEPARFNLAIHNGMITVHNPATGDHRTFSIRTVQRDRSWCKRGDRLAYLLIGPDRSADWKPFGFIHGNTINVFRKLRGDGVRSDYEKFASILSDPTRFKSLRYLMVGHCRRCNRPLTHPDSIDSGLGPVCAGKE